MSSRFLTTVWHLFQEKVNNSTSAAPTSSNPSDSTRLPSSGADSQQTPASLRLSVSSEKNCDYESELESLGSRKIESRPREGSSFTKWVSVASRDAAVGGDRSNVTVESPVSWSDKNKSSGAVDKPSSSSSSETVAKQQSTVSLAADADSDAAAPEEISDDDYEVILLSSSED